MLLEKNAEKEKGDWKYFNSSNVCRTRHIFVCLNLPNELLRNGPLILLSPLRKLYPLMLIHNWNMVMGFHNRLDHGFDRKRQVQRHSLQVHDWSIIICLSLSLLLHYYNFSISCKTIQN